MRNVVFGANRYISALFAALLFVGAACGDPGGDGNGGGDAGTGDSGTTDTGGMSGDVTGGGDTTADGSGDTGGGGPDCSSPEELEGPIDEDTVLSPDDAECLVVASVVEVSANLTIEPGVGLLFEAGAGLSIKEGTLTAEGTAQDPILMTGTEKLRGHWKGIQFINTKSSKNKLDYVTIEYAGGGSFRGAGKGALVLNATGIYGSPLRVEITNTTVRQSETAGFWAEQGSNIASFSNNTFTKNKGVPARVHPKLIRDLGTSSTFSGNETDHVKVVEGSISAEEHTWPAIDVDYHFVGGATITDDASVSISPETTFVFEQDKGLNVKDGGTLAADGGESESGTITFTGLEEVRGFWKGIHYRGTKSSKNKLNRVVIEYAGGSSYRGAKSAGLMLNSSGIYGSELRIAIDNTTIRESGGFGLFAEKNAIITSFEQNVLTKSKEAAAELHPRILKRMSDTSDFSGNDDNWLKVVGGTLKSGDHTWPAINIPYRVTDHIFIEDQAHVGIDAGATFEFVANKGLSAKGGGSLAANGTSQDQIVFKAIEDTSGFWTGIHYRGTESSKNLLKHTVIRHGGGNSFRGAEAAGLQLNSQGIYGEPLRISLESVEISDFSPGAAVYNENQTTLNNCTSLSGFTSSDVIGNGAANFRSQCGL